MFAPWHLSWHAPVAQAVAQVAQLAARQPPVDWRDTLWATLGLVGAVMVGVLVIWYVDRWRKRAAEPAESDDDRLAHFQELFDKGEISPQEFERIRGIFGKRLRQRLDLPAPAREEDRPPDSPQAGARPDASE
jgi:hypothetical protein